MMRKRILFGLLLALSLFLLTGCASIAYFLRGEYLAQSMRSDRETANAVFEQVLTALEHQDAEAVRTLFSKSATTEDAQFEEDLLALLALYKGKLISYDDWAGPTVQSAHLPEGDYKLLEPTYDVVTSEQKYRFALQIYVENTIDPDHVGIYSLYVIKREDDPNDSAYWGSGELPGITIETEREKL